jgi:hypothetical protein
MAPAIFEEGDQTPKEPAFPLYKRLAPLVQYPHRLRLPLHARIIERFAKIDTSAD